MALSKVEGEMVGVSTTGKYKGPQHTAMLGEVGGDNPLSKQGGLLVS